MLYPISVVKRRHYIYNNNNQSLTLKRKVSDSKKPKNFIFPGDLPVQAGAGRSWFYSKHITNRDSAKDMRLIGNINIDFLLNQDMIEDFV